MGALIVYVLGVIHIGVIFYTVHTFIIPCPKNQRVWAVCVLVLWPVSWLLQVYILYQHREFRRDPFQIYRR